MNTQTGKEQRYEAPRRYKCQHCGQVKRSDEFYTSESGRASPYCIACNPSACLLAKYKTEIRTKGSKAFGAKIEAKENQLQLMLRAASEVRV